MMWDDITDFLSLVWCIIRAILSVVIPITVILGVPAILISFAITKMSVILYTLIPLSIIAICYIIWYHRLPSEERFQVKRNKNRRFRWIGKMFIED